LTEHRQGLVVNKAPEEHEAIDDPHREALARTGFFGEQAAGTVTIAADTGRMMLVLRSEKVEQPGTHGNAGGAHLKEEDPEVAALREHGEETGWEGDILAMIPAFVFRKDDFVYRNFVTVVPHEYEPELGWEADSAVWCTTSDLPSPLHFGIEALLADPESREILEGGWQRFVGETPYREAPPIFVVPEGPMFLEASRPLSPETVQRIAQGVEKWIKASDAIVGMFEASRPGGPPTWEFEVVLALDELPDDATLDIIHQAGCDDGMVALQNGVVSICFAREAADLRSAVESAVVDVRKTGIPVSRIQVEGLADAIPFMDLVD
jgi:8-oxo-dGTP pyrophosphatase MutT (NUDIX family)